MFQVFSCDVFKFTVRKAILKSITCSGAQVAVKFRPEHLNNNTNTNTKVTETNPSPKKEASTIDWNIQNP